MADVVDRAVNNQPPHCCICCLTSFHLSGSSELCRHDRKDCLYEKECNTVPQPAINYKMHWDGDILKCPECGSTFLHHNDVRMYNRDKEDGQTIRTIIDTHNYIQQEPVRNNPSTRRDAVSICFWCENCDSKPVLNIVQHKGQTYMSWDV